MLDINLFRENPEIIKKSELKRGRTTKNVDKVIEFDKKWKKAQKKIEELRAERNKISLEINLRLKKGDKDITDLRKKVKENESKREKLEAEVKRLLEKRDSFRYKVGNILAEDVPEGDEDKNIVVEKFGKVEKKIVEGHADILEKADLIDTKKAAQVSGSRFYYLKGKLVLLNLALIHYAFDKLIKKGFKPMWTPDLLRSEVMKGASELSAFEDTLYKIENEDLFLIATAEQTIASYHYNEILEEKELPKCYVGFSQCFRKEAGSHGKDTKGIFRIHQFDKIEQYVLCKPEDSWEWFNKLVENEKEIYKELGLPFRIVDIASYEMNDTAAKKYDIEVWFPSQGKYREVCSCSNTTDYQTRNLNIKIKKGKEKTIPHALNATAIATERTITAIAENYYDKNKKIIKIPKVLQKYTGFSEIKLQ